MAIDWGQVRHAYGPAADTPGHLHALEFGDAGARQAALDHLEVAVLHQGMPGTATARAVRAVTELLAEGRAQPETVEYLLQFLCGAARAVTDLAGHHDFTQVLPDLADAVAAAYPVVLPLLEFSPLHHAASRAINLVAIAKLTTLADQRQNLAILIADVATRDPGPQEPWVYCLGQLGVDVRDRLTDPEPAVRLRVALIHEDDPRSQQLIRAALAEPPPPRIDRNELVAAAIRTASDFAIIAAEACGLVRKDSWTGFHSGWGALVKFAFPEPYTQLSPLTDMQRALLRALAANDDRELWNPRNGSCGLVFRQAGLPHDRSACRRLAG